MKLTFLLLTILSLLSAQNSDQTVMKSLLLSPSALSTAKADNGVAMPFNAALAMHFNPAGLIFPLNNRGYNASFNYAKINQGLQTNDDSYTYFAGSYKVPNGGAFGTSFRYLNLGEQDYTLASGPSAVDKFNSYEFEFALAYALEVSKRTSLGLKISYLKSSIFPENIKLDNNFSALSPSTIAFDFGGLYYMNDEMNTYIGASISNLGGQMSFLDRKGNGENQAFNLPTVFRAGVMRDLYQDDLSTTKVYGSLDIRFLSSIGMAAGLNANYSYEGLFEFRLGFAWDDNIFHQKSFYTTGLGLNYQTYQVDFSYKMISSEFNQVNPASNSINLSLSLNLESNFNDDSQEIKDISLQDNQIELSEDLVDNSKLNEKIVIDESFNDSQKELANAISENRTETLKAISNEVYEPAIIQPEIFDVQSENLVQQSVEYKKVDYQIVGKIMVVVNLENDKTLHFKITHLLQNKTDAFTVQGEQVNYFKDIKRKAIIIFSLRTNRVIRCYSGSTDKYIYFTADKINYKYDRESEITYRVSFGSEEKDVKEEKKEDDGEIKTIENQKE